MPVRFRDLLIPPRQTLADDAREIWILIRGAGTFIDQASLFQFGEGQSAGGDGAILIQHFVGLSIKQNAPIPRFTEIRRALGAEACSAIAGNSVVPTRSLVQSVYGTYVFAKSLLRLGRGSQRVVKINILALIISAQTNAIALFCHNVNERVLPIKTFQSGVLLSNSLARFDGKAEGKAMRKLKADNGMRDPRRTPVIDSQVHSSDLRKPHRARFPARSEIRLGAVVTIPHIVDGELIAVDLCPCSLGYIRLPRTIIARLQGKPPQDHNRKCAKDDRKLRQFSANEYDDREQRDYEQNCYESARLWKIKIERAKRPCCTNECNHPRESPAYVFDYTRAKQGERPFRYALL